MYSFRDFQRDWVYAIDKDFHSSNGTTSATWAAGAPSEWGCEHAKIPFRSEPGAASLNADASLLAIALENDIHLYSTSNLKLYQLLQGHISRVDGLHFHPKDARTLISCAMNERAGSTKTAPEIIFWHTGGERDDTLLRRDIIHALSQRAVGTIAQGLGLNLPSSWQMDVEDRNVLTKSIEDVITSLNTKSELRPKTRISGRLTNHFGANVFNSTGSSMAFLPGPRPPSNGDNKWDICIYDLLTNGVRLTLSGHRDAIMLVGFSPNDKLIASVSWDRTFRIWDHDTGNLLHTFQSDGQNWTGAFSPDSRFFAGTSGQGRLWVWDVVHGLEVATHELPLGSWHRCLDWSPQGKRLVVGGRLGSVVVFDVKSQSVVQERILSMKKSPRKLQNIGSSFLEIGNVRYLDEGRKIAFKCTCDDGLEVYDFLENRKWRFAPTEGLDRGRSSTEFLVLEEKGMIASVDADAVRFWKVPFGKKE
ncbi:hypothetical protein BDR22DRAFT_859123 [Usnea florida]